MKMGRRLSGSCRIGYVLIRYAPSSRPAAAGPTAHFDRNENHLIYGTGHYEPATEAAGCSRHSVGAWLLRPLQLRIEVVGRRSRCRYRYSSFARALRVQLRTI